MSRTLEERENLSKLVQPKCTGFTPRCAEKLATSRKPHTSLDIECSQFLRGNSSNSNEFNHDMLAYRLWLEAARSDSTDHVESQETLPAVTNNSSTWRNFSQKYPLDRRESHNLASQKIAAIYPVSIPRPSTMGELTYSKFLLNSPVIKDEKVQQLAIKKSMQDYAEFERLRLKSEMRRPPISKYGNILPPSSMPKNIFQFRVVPTELDCREQPPEDLQLKEGTRVDIFGREIPPSSYKQSQSWKLFYKLNNPKYEQVKGTATARPQNRSTK